MYHFPLSIQSAVVVVVVVVVTNNSRRIIPYVWIIHCIPLEGHLSDIWAYFSDQEEAMDYGYLNNMLKKV